MMKNKKARQTIAGFEIITLVLAIISFVVIISGGVSGENGGGGGGGDGNSDFVEGKIGIERGGAKIFFPNDENLPVYSSIDGGRTWSESYWYNRNNMKEFALQDDKIERTLLGRRPSVVRLREVRGAKTMREGGGVSGASSSPNPARGINFQQPEPIGGFKVTETMAGRLEEIGVELDAGAEIEKIVPGDKGLILKLKSGESVEIDGEKIKEFGRITGTSNSITNAYRNALYEGLKGGKGTVGELIGEGTRDIGGVWEVSSESIKGTDMAKVTFKNKITGDEFTKELSTKMRLSQISSIEITGQAAPKLPLLGEIPVMGGLGYILEGLAWGLGVAGLIQLIGGLAGMESKAINSASIAAIIGGGVKGAVSAIIGKGGLITKDLGLAMKTKGLWWKYTPHAAGIVAAIIVFGLMDQGESKKVVNFKCNPWEAPTGGSDCEKCNDGLYPCTEYRCKSLGQACELLNPGTGEEACVWVNPKDVNSPIIETWDKVLTKDHKYDPNTAIRPPDRGVKILYEKSNDGCIKAFTPLSFGITLNEPAQCKIDYNRTAKYEDMNYYFGGSNIYKYNHTQVMRLPGPDAVNAEAPELKNDGNYNLYVRCQDANGNSNDDLFVFSFCVERGPDVTPPKIEGTSISNGMPIQYGLNQTKLEVYVNEPSECKWSKTDQDYEAMEHSFDCASHVYEMNNLMLYKCEGILTDLEDRKDNVFYFRCKDQPWLTGEKQVDRNVNVESYKFILKGTQPLNIVNVKPNETITGYSTLATVNLEVETEAGYNLGDSWCSYYCISVGEEASVSEDRWIQMFETGTNIHKQRLDLPADEYICEFQCVDLGGNAAYSNTTFKVEIDEEAPKVVRVYQDSGKLKIITDEKSICSYSTNKEKECSFDIDEGTNMPYANSKEHFADWEEGKTYYVKCKDSNERQPLPNECSIVVRAES